MTLQPANHGDRHRACINVANVATDKCQGHAQARCVFRKHIQKHIQKHKAMDIDKTFHHSDPYDVTCDNCKFSVFDIEKGLFCKCNNEPVKAYWKCDYANSIRN